MMMLIKNQRIAAFTLVEIMIVVAIIGLLAALAVPSFLRARMRSQGTAVLNEARQLDGSKDQWALENNKTGTATPAFADLTPYLKVGSRLAANLGNDSMGNAFTIGPVTTTIRVNVATKDGLSDATGGDTFWGPYS